MPMEKLESQKELGNAERVSKEAVNDEKEKPVQ